MDTLNTAYKLLLENGVVGTQEDFSARFLHKSPRYYSMVKASGSKPSVEALSTLAVRLQRLGDDLLNTNCQSISTLGKDAYELAHKLWEDIESRSLWRQPHKQSYIKPKAEAPKSYLARATYFLLGN